ncbi:MAG: aspartate 1-decarboxylase [Nitrospira sp.]
MFRQMLRSKIHRATVTESCLEYEGSLTVDEDLLDVAGILPYEAIIISNLNNGERFMTYAMTGKRGSGEIVLNGPTARKGAVGDQVIIFCYEYYAEDEIKRHVPKIVRVDGKNQIVRSSAPQAGSKAKSQ